jgi:hypothetical protein
MHTGDTPMKTKITFIVTALAMLIAACAPAAGASPASTETPVPAPVSAAVVESVEIQILESMPVQVNAIVRGHLPDAGCTTIRSVEQVRDGNTFRLTLITITNPLALCAQALTSFEEIVALNVRDLPAGTYILNVHGAESSFELPGYDLPTFQARLASALDARDYDLLRTMMDETFMIAYWRSEGITNTPDQAIEQLHLNLLNSSAPIAADENKDLTALLGMDPVAIVGPEGTEVSPLFVCGWGPEGRDEAILFIAGNPDGSFYWYGVLFAKDGFENP